MGSRGRIGPVAVVGTFLGLAMLACGITCLYLGMRSVMEIGGTCAEGGPYVTRQDCPDGAPALLFGGAWGGLIGAGIFGLSVRRFGGRYWMLLLWAWPALFLSLGWNFLEYGLDGPGETETVTGWMVCAVVFGLMGGLPLLYLLWPSQLRKVFWPPDRKDPARAAPLTGMLSRAFRAAGRTDGDVRPSARPVASTPAPAWTPPATPPVTAPPAPSAPDPDLGAGLWTGLPGAIPQATPPPAAGGTPGAGGNDLVGRLERLAQLKASGAIDEAEYERAKQSLLGGGA